MGRRVEAISHWNTLPLAAAWALQRSPATIHCTMLLLCHLLINNVSLETEGQHHVTATTMGLCREAAPSTVMSSEEAFKVHPGSYQEQ